MVEKVLTTCSLHAFRGTLSFSGRLFRHVRRKGAPGRDLAKELGCKVVAAGAECSRNAHGQSLDRDGGKGCWERNCGVVLQVSSGALSKNYGPFGEMRVASLKKILVLMAVAESARWKKCS